MNDAIMEAVCHWFLYPLSKVFQILAFLIILTILRRIFVRHSKKNAVAVVVLGDIGRSPRMQYHALSLSKHSYDVKFIGYPGSIPHQSILDETKINLFFIQEFFSFKGGAKLLTYVLKVFSQSLGLLWTFFYHVGATEYILLQNPPCIPSLAVCWIISLLNGSKLIVDWHNYGYSILALTLGKSHLLVKIAKWYEEIFGQLSNGHLCVTKAIAEDLMTRWNISAEVMHDRPAAIFKPISLDEKHELFMKLSEEYPSFASRDKKSQCTRFSVKESKKASLLADRPAILISSTSWTEDEDFSILLEALEGYEAEAAESDSRLPNIVCVITGKGPLKSYYKKIISEKRLNHVEVVTPWLEAEDYPKLLACADLGVSLHTSSSGLDLPMKVVDMFGAGLPVAAINFKCLDELVEHNVNGVVFDDASTLTKQLLNAFKDFPQQSFLNGLRKNVEEFRNVNWDDSWDRIVLPIFHK